MPEPRDDYEPTEAEIERVVEESGAKQMKSAKRAAGIRFDGPTHRELQAEKTKPLDRMDEAF